MNRVMNPAADNRSNVASITAAYALPTLLALNTLALLTLDRLGQIPAWLKSAVALFLSF